MGNVITRRAVSITEAATMLNLDRHTVSRMVHDGTLTARRIGPRTIRISVRSIDHWLEGDRP